MWKLYFFNIFVVIVTFAPCYAVEWAITYNGGMIRLNYSFLLLVEKGSAMALT